MKIADTRGIGDLRRSLRERLLASPARLVVLLFAAMLTVSGASAHPLGNNTVNRQAALAVEAGRIVLIYRMDFAEIPTLAAVDEADTDGDGVTSPVEWRNFGANWASEVMQALTLQVDGQRLQQRLRLTRDHVTHRLTEGEAGLAVLHLEARFTAALPESKRLSIAYADHFRPQQAGWKEIWVRGAEGIDIRGSVARADRSHDLVAYPINADLPQETLARFSASLALGPRTPNARTVAPADLAPATAAFGNVEADADRLHGIRTASEADPGSVSTRAASPRAISDLVADSAKSIDPDDSRPPEVGSAETAPSGAWAFFRLGMHHIATGWDHLAFLLGLLLLAPRLAEAVRVVTAFTIAHSVTLLLAAAGWVAPPGAVVEPAIALTIAYVGAMALWRRAAGHGVWLALIFGLVHGFGFAGALAETLGASARTPGWLLNLVAFNLGIEVFQLALVATALTLYVRFKSLSWLPAAHGLASFVVLAGGFTLFLFRL